VAKSSDKNEYTGRTGSVAQAIKSVDRGKKEAGHAHVDSDEGRVGEEIGVETGDDQREERSAGAEKLARGEEALTTNVNWRI
jgi:hypothetical protein